MQFSASKSVGRSVDITKVRFDDNDARICWCTSICMIEVWVLTYRPRSSIRSSSFLSTVRELLISIWLMSVLCHGYLQFLML